MINAAEFFVWIIIGGFYSLFLAFRDMWRSRTGRDIVSKIKTTLNDERK